METVLISVENVSRQYTPEINSGVRDINFTIEQGKVVAIVGESGSGKSTLLKLLYGLLSPDSGSVMYRGQPVKGPDEKLIPGHDRMKMVTQDFSLNTYAKVYDNIASMLSNADLQGKKSNTERMMELLRISHLASKRVADLSGGEQQRVAIARAMITAPEVLLLDEPFSQVDTLFRSQLRSDIRNLPAALGTTVILVSHDPIDGLSLADELIVIKEGRLVEKGAPRVLYQSPATGYTARLIADSTVLSAADALKLGIDAGGRDIAIHPEWVRIRQARDEQEFAVRQRFYRGAFTEIMIEKNGVVLKARTENEDPGSEPEHTGAVISKWIAV